MFRREKRAAPSFLRQALSPHPYCHSEERSDAGISISIMQRNLARGYVSLRGAERRGNLIQFNARIKLRGNLTQFNARIKLRGNLLLVTHIYEYVK